MTAIRVATVVALLFLAACEGSTARTEEQHDATARDGTRDYDKLVTLDSSATIKVSSIRIGAMRWCIIVESAHDLRMSCL